jgi:hypothetical protein
MAAASRAAPKHTTSPCALLARARAPVASQAMSSTALGALTRGGPVRMLVGSVTRAPLGGGARIAPRTGARRSAASDSPSSHDLPKAWR